MRVDIGKQVLDGFAVTASPADANFRETKSTVALRVARFSQDVYVQDPSLINALEFNISLSMDGGDALSIT